MKARTIFIGDIQGCYDEFRALLKKLKINKEDKIYLVGDLINKGPKSLKVLKYVYKHQDQFKSVLGNHELGFLLKLNGEKLCSKKSFRKLKRKLDKNPELIKYMRNLPLYIEEKDFVLLHGGLIPGKELKSHSADEITNLRMWQGKPWYEYYKGKKKIIYGHWAVDGLRIRENTIGIDSGCVYGKALSAYILETGEIIQKQADNIYVNVYVNQDYYNGFVNKMYASKNKIIKRISRYFNKTD